MRFNDEGGVLGNISCGFLGSVLHDETAETTQIDVLLIVRKAVTYLLHESLYGGGYVSLVYSCLISDGVNYLCFRHINIMCILIMLFCFGLQRYCFSVRYENFYRVFFENLQTSYLFAAEIVCQLLFDTSVVIGEILDNLAFFQQGDARGDIDGVLQIVRADENCCTRSGLVIQQRVFKDVLACRVKEVERFVENDDGGISEEG